MNKYSTRSLERLESCHPDLQRLFKTVLPHFDHSIVCGARGEAAQNKAYEDGNSKLRYPLSEHNKVPSLAVDAFPYPIDWGDTERMAYFAGHVRATAKMMGLNIRCGLDWDQDTQMKDERFRDYGHFELIGGQYAR